MKAFRISIVAALTVVSALPLFAQNYTAFDFLRIPMSARAGAMANTSVTYRNDATSVFYNPAGISTLEQPAAALGFVKYLMDVNAGFLSYGQKLMDYGWVGGGITYMNYGEFDYRDKTGAASGETFGASDLAVSLGYANIYENINYGGAVKVIYSSIENYTSSALAVDLGALYYIPGEELTVGVSILNLGAQLSTYAGVDEDLPFEVRIGASQRLAHLPLTIMLNFHKLNDKQDNFIDHFGQFSVGGEFDLSQSLKARFGYHNEMRQELKVGSSAGFTGLSLGVGVKVSSLLFDYGYNSMGKIGSLHRISLSTAFMP